MKTANFVIYDFDEEYTDNLMQYISAKQGFMFKTKMFTEKKLVLEYASGNCIDILLVSDEAMSEEIKRENNIRNIILLSRDKFFLEDEEYVSIYKYQSMESLIRQVLDYYADIHKGEEGAAVFGESADIIGVYSPVGRCGKTTFALTFGQILAQEASVLYINMEEFAAFNKILKREYPGDLSDLMYFFKQNRESLPIKLQAIVRNMNGMDYIPPLIYSSDLRNIETSEWIELIMAVAKNGDYDHIIVDLGSIVGDVFKVLDICGTIYMPSGGDVVSVGKVAACEEYLLKSGREELADRIIKVELPMPENNQEGEILWERQQWGRLGDFVRSMIGGEVE